MKTGYETEKRRLTPQPVQKEPETATKVLRKTEAVTRHSSSSFWGFLTSLGDFLDKPDSKKASSLGNFLSRMLKLFLSNPFSMLFCLSIPFIFSSKISVWRADSRKVKSCEELRSFCEALMYIEDWIFLSTSLSLRQLDILYKSHK